MTDARIADDPRPEIGTVRRNSWATSPLGCTCWYRYIGLGNWERHTDDPNCGWHHPADDDAGVPW